MDNLVIVVGVVSPIVWFLITLLVQKKNMNRSLVSAITFGVWYTVFYFVGGYLYTLFDKMHNPNMNRYTLGIGSIAVWFLFALIFQKKSMDRAVKSAGIFAMYVVLAEVIYAVLKTMNIRL